MPSLDMDMDMNMDTERPDSVARGMRDGMRQYKSTGSAVRHARPHVVWHARLHATDTDKAGCTTTHGAVQSHASLSRPGLYAGSIKSRQSRERNQLQHR